MKAIILGTDFLKDSDGNLKIIETNSNVDIHNQIVPELNWIGFKQFLIDNSISDLHLIYTTNNIIPNQLMLNDFDTSVPNVSISDKLEEIISELSGSFTAHPLPKNSVTVPQIDDSDTTLIIRTSYDISAIVDEEYTKDKVNFHRLIDSKPYSVNVYYNSTTDTTLNIDELTELHVTDGDTPNYIVKTRLPHTNYSIYPKIYKIDSLEKLQNLKESITDLEFIEEYQSNTNNIVNDKMSVIRSLDILYGGQLDCLHLGSYSMSSVIKHTEWETIYNSDGLMDTSSRLLWMTKGVDDKFTNLSYILDSDTPLLKNDGSVSYPTDILENDIVKTISLPWVPLNETGSGDVPAFIFNVNSGSFAYDLNTFTTGSTTVVKLESSTNSSLMIQVTLENGIVYNDLAKSAMMIEEYDTLRTTFSFTNSFRVNDSIVFFDYNNNTLTKSKITNLEIVYVDNITIYDVNVEEIDIFLPVADSDLGLSFIQHNPPGFCSSYCWYWECWRYECAGCSYCGGVNKQ